MSESFSTGHANMICSAFKTAYTNCVIGIFGGSAKPASADLAEAGTLLALITLGGGAFSAGAPTNGLNFGTPSNGVLAKAVETWLGNGLPAAGAGTNATYFRMYANAYVTGASSTAVRYDGDCSVDTSGELQLQSLSVVNGSPVVINNFTYTPPKV